MAYFFFLKHNLFLQNIYTHRIDKFMILQISVSLYRHTSIAYLCIHRRGGRCKPTRFKLSLREAPFLRLEPSSHSRYVCSWSRSIAGLSTRCSSRMALVTHHADKWARTYASLAKIGENGGIYCHGI